jgi:hypothetical protein
MLAAGCVRCSAPVLESPDRPGSWSCPEHGATAPLWRPEVVSYEAFTAHLETAGAFPTYAPWPMGPGWSISDFGCVTAGRRDATATVTCTTGTTELDGPVDVLVVAEEPGAGLGARCAGTRHVDPGAEIHARPPTARVRIDSQTVTLWDVSTSASHGELDRSVVAGEARGRWLWMVLRPASALLLLRDDWILRDLSELGPPLVELSFGGPGPAW